MKMRINYEDDLVVVKNSKGETIYKGIEDYEPMKRGNWVWNDSKRLYELTLDGKKYTKTCYGS